MLKPEIQKAIREIDPTEEPFVMFDRKGMLQIYSNNLTVRSVYNEHNKEIGISYHIMGKPWTDFSVQLYGCD